MVLKALDTLGDREKRDLFRRLSARERWLSLERTDADVFARIKQIFGNPPYYFLEPEDVPERFSGQRTRNVLVGAERIRLERVPVYANFRPQLRDVVGREYRFRTFEELATVTGADVLNPDDLPEERRIRYDIESAGELREATVYMRLPIRLRRAARRGLVVGVQLMPEPGEQLFLYHGASHSFLKCLVVSTSEFNPERATGNVRLGRLANAGRDENLVSLFDFARRRM